MHVVISGYRDKEHRSISNQELYSYISDNIRFRKNVVQPNENAVESEPMSLNTCRESVEA